MKAEILTPWILIQMDDGTPYNCPKVTQDYPNMKYMDATGQPSENISPDPNLFIAEIVCDEATLDLIEADNQYQVLWSEA